MSDKAVLLSAKIYNIAGEGTPETEATTVVIMGLGDEAKALEQALRELGNMREEVFIGLGEATDGLELSDQTKEILERLK